MIYNRNKLALVYKLCAYGVSNMTRATTLLLDRGSEYYVTDTASIADRSAAPD